MADDKETKRIANIYFCIENATFPGFEKPKPVAVVELEYPPRTDENISEKKVRHVEIGMLDVRATDNIRVSFDFERDGNLTIVRAIGDDVQDVADIVERVNATGKLDKVGVDPVGIGAIVDAMVAAGIEQERIVGISQGWKLAGAIKTAERKLAEGGLKHGGAPLMAWSVGNAKVEPRGNAIAITKQAAGYAKIDPLMAMFNSVALMSLAPEVERSVYDLLAREEAARPFVEAI
jgi:phage terminase large subunit-like protein